MGRIRTFIAVAVSDGVRTRIADLIGHLRTSGAKTSWTKPANMHLTLKFLGDTSETRIPDVCRAVSGAVERIAPFQLALTGAGAFPNDRRPRTVWIGAEQGSREICELAEMIETALHAGGFPREHRRFKPHLTIGRVRGGGPAQIELGRLIGSHTEFEAGTSPIDEVLVFASHLASSGPTYQVLGRAPLGARPE